MSRRALIWLVAVLVVIVMAFTMWPEEDENLQAPPAVGDRQDNPAEPAD
jgi:lipopolysaccharide export system protein LptC